MKINYSKHVWEGWTVLDFIQDLSMTIRFREFKDREELKRWCKDNQPYYKKHIPEVYNHFVKELGL